MSEQYRTPNTQKFGNIHHSVSAFREAALQKSSSLYPRDRSGILTIILADESDTLTADALISEHRPAESRQHIIEIKRGSPSALELPAGGYTVVVRAAGFKPHRAYVEVPARESIAVSACLQEPAEKSPSIEQVLRKFGVKVTDFEEKELKVPEDTSLTLDGRESSHAGNMKKLKITSADHAKAVFGYPDEYWPGEQPCFGPIDARPSDVRAPRPDMNIMLDTRFAMREYLYGNSKSVHHWKDELDHFFANDALIYAIYYWTTVTVDKGAVLNVGAAGLICGTLRVHRQGKVRVVGQGPTTFDVMRYEQFLYPYEILTPVDHVFHF